MLSFKCMASISLLLYVCVCIYITKYLNTTCQIMCYLYVSDFRADHLVLDILILDFEKVHIKVNESVTKVLQIHIWSALIKCLKSSTITPKWLYLHGVVCSLVILVVTLWSVVTALWVLSLAGDFPRLGSSSPPYPLFSLISPIFCSLFPRCLLFGFLSSAYLGFCVLLWVHEDRL